VEHPGLSALPKAVLHDHLDGGLRAATLLELADESERELPASDLASLEAAMHQGQSGSLVEYLRAFDHTVGVMQTPQAVARVAYEAVVDHHADGVTYAELRFAPSLVTAGLMSREDAIEAALGGLARGATDTGVTTGLIVTAMRGATDSLEVATAAGHFVGEGVVGFDLAGAEAGNPVDDHLPAIRYARERGLGITLHAGEASGLESIAGALGKGAAQRLGHGVRIIDDCKVVGGEIVELGLLAARVRDQRVPLECAVTSNLHTRVAVAAASHPFAMLYRAGFNVTINTDNRLMSGVTMSGEFELLARECGLSRQDLGDITVRTLEAGFGDWLRRRRLIETVEQTYATTS